MREFNLRQAVYSSILLQAEAPPAEIDSCQRQLPGICGGGNLRWRCTDCFGCPFVCGPCLLEDHQLNPFHRVKVWDATEGHFRRSSLQQAGFVLHVGHGGAKCPTFRANTFSMPSGDGGLMDTAFGHPPTHNMVPEEVAIDAEEEDGDTDWEDTPPLAQQGHSTPGIPFDEYLHSHFQIQRNVVIGHVNGFHQHTFRFCRCLGASAEWRQLLGLGLWSATFRIPRTVFTSECLRDQIYHSVHCKTSVNAYHTKMQKETHQGVARNFPVRHLRDMDSQQVPLTSLPVSD